MIGLVALTHITPYLVIAYFLERLLYLGALRSKLLFPSFPLRLNIEPWVVLLVKSSSCFLFLLISTFLISLLLSSTVITNQLFILLPIQHFMSAPSILRLIATLFVRRFKLESLNFSLFVVSISWPTYSPNLLIHNRFMVFYLDLA